MSAKTAALSSVSAKLQKHNRKVAIALALAVEWALAFAFARAFAQSIADANADEDQRWWDDMEARVSALERDHGYPTRRDHGQRYPTVDEDERP